MEAKTKFYIDGKWVAPAAPKELEVINPADETAYATISLGSRADVDIAVDAARKAFPDWADTPIEARIALIEKLAEIYIGPFVGGAIENWFAYMLALAFLLFRPQGLFGEKIIERV